MSQDARSSQAQELQVPELSLVVLVGASGSGKSTFAREHFSRTEVISSDFCRGLVSDDETTSRRRRMHSSCSVSSPASD
jgi:protein phosphatase